MNKSENINIDELEYQLIKHILDSYWKYIKYKDEIILFFEKFIKFLRNNKNKKFENYKFNNGDEGFLNNMMKILKKKYYPVEDIELIDNFMKNHKIPKNFYPCFPVDSDLYQILINEQNYKTIEDKYFEELEKIPFNQNISDKNKKIIEEIAEKNPKYQIKFIDFIYENTEESYFYYPRGKYFYFSTKLLDKENLKQFVSQKISRQMKILKQQNDDDL